MIKQEEANSLLFLLRADEFYILTRYSYWAFLQYSTFRLVHHALEYYLKAGLSYYIAPKQLKKFGHKLTALWTEYKIYAPNLIIDERVIEHIDSFESMRYPDVDSKFCRVAWGLPYKQLFEEVMHKVPKVAQRTIACLNIEDVDHVVYTLRNSIPHGNEMSVICSGQDQEHYLFRKNNYFTKNLNPGFL